MEVWIGLAHVKPREGNDLLDYAFGAFVSAVGLAENENDFASAVVNLLDKQEFDVVEIEDIETLRKRQLHYSIDSKISELAANLSPERPIELGTFHAYERE